MKILDIVSAESQMQQGSSQIQSSHMRLASLTLQSDIGISSLSPDMVSNSSPMQQWNPVEPVCFNACRRPPQAITIQELDLDEQIVMAHFSSVD
jgi:hypothetical protein